ncbi:heme exporter protein CcmB [Sanyastnella coralliicola]|uniref:heme exporter protein CcmB n=1 Tax=Sanyastnella coralliicola TaxID=3069118 RepID=UPI0027B8AA5C|nr:heme exporter protein CcmB [Longitalea sp. SCSIO 12813]
MLNRIFFLIRHEARLEFRQQHTLVGIGLFALSTVYLCYQAFESLEDETTWNALLWVIVLFTAFSAVGKSFQTQERGIRLYLYYTIKPQEYILAKVFYNSFLMMLLGLVAFGSYALFLGSTPIDGKELSFILGLLGGCFGFATLLTLISAIASQSETGIGLTAVLGLPIAIPLIILINNYNKQVIAGLPLGENLINLSFLLVLSIAIGVLSYLLFPYLWRD